MTDINVGQLSEAINDKMDRDMDNMNPSTTPKSTLASYSMPSSRYTDLTLGASGTTYTAPANGWHCIQCYLAGAGYNCQIINQTSGIRTLSNTVDSSGNTVMLYVPCQKDDEVVVNYSVTPSSVTVFRFIYAEGDNT